jgi:heme-degrading monooxygenase HmoA
MIRSPISDLLASHVDAKAEEVQRREKVIKTEQADRDHERKGNVMHVLIVNFGLDGISEEQYGGLAESVAPAFADLPGLVSKAWLANEETNIYGGVYIWQDRQAMEAYKQSDIYKGMANNPHFKDVTVKDFAVLENPTRTTRGPAEPALRAAN